MLTGELPLQGLTIDDDFRRFVCTLRPPFAFNPGGFDQDDDLFVALPDGSGWVYVGTPANTWKACELMADVHAVTYVMQQWRLHMVGNQVEKDGA